MVKIYKKIQNPQLFITGLVLAIVIAIADLYSKSVIFRILDNEIGQYIKVTGFFNLVKVLNTGVSFGMFNNLTYGTIILSAVAIIITIILVIWLSQIESKHMSIALGFVIGGAGGNIIDRIVNGAVADFLDFHIAGYHWPAFNLADTTISIGAAIMIFDEFILPRIKTKNNNVEKSN